MTNASVIPQLVAGYDRSSASEEALRVALDLATRLGAELHVLHVIDLHDYPVDPDRADWEEQAERTLDQERERVRELLAAWPGTWTYHAERGEPVRALVGLADDVTALMIVVGSRGGGLGPAVQRLLDGSVSHRLTRGQHRPVLVVADPGSRREQPNEG